jgi:integrase
VVIGYHIGARKSEILGIKLEQIDLHDSVIRLYDTKRSMWRGRWLAIYGEMGDTIGKQVGQPLGITLVALGSSIVKATLLLTFDPQWPDACDAVGLLSGLLFHDLRRSAGRNMERAGTSREVAKKISGHKTDAVFNRYNIVSGRDIEDAGKKLAQFLKGQA